MHNNLLLTLGNLGALYRTTGRAEKALPLLEEALTLKRKVYGNNSNSTRVAMLNLIAAYHSADQPEKATPHCRQAAALFTKHLKPGHSLIFTAKSLQGENYIRIQQPAAAEPICRECLEVRQKTIPDHFLTFNSMSLLGWSLSRQKKFKQAEPMLLNGYAGLKAREKKIPARARSMIDNAVRRIIEFYEAQDDTVKVREWKQKLIQQRTKKPLTSKGP